MTSPLQDAFTSRVSALYRRIIPALVPLFRKGRSGRPDLVGTGVLIQAGSHTLVATAGHVSDEVPETQIYCGLGTSLVTVPKQRFFTKPEPRQTRDTDRIDVSFWDLRGEYLKLVNRRLAVQLTECDISASSPQFRTEDSDYLVFGYPASRQAKWVKPTGEYDLQDFTFVGRPYSADEVAGVSPPLETAILIEYDKDDSYRLSGHHRGPDVYGVSGGAVWHYPGLMNPYPGKPLLAGLAVSWRKASPKGIVVTRIAHVMRGALELMQGNLQ